MEVDGDKNDITANDNVDIDVDVDINVDVDDNDNLNDEEESNDPEPKELGLSHAQSTETADNEESASKTEVIESSYASAVFPLSRIKKVPLILCDSFS